MDVEEPESAEIEDAVKRCVDSFGEIETTADKSEVTIELLEIGAEYLSSIAKSCWPDGRLQIISLCEVVTAYK